jgi:hypothetical protein
LGGLAIHLRSGIRLRHCGPRHSQRQQGQAGLKPASGIGFRRPAADIIACKPFSRDTARMNSMALVLSASSMT